MRLPVQDGAGSPRRHVGDGEHSSHRSGGHSGAFAAAHSPTAASAALACSSPAGSASGQRARQRRCSSVPLSCDADCCCKLQQSALQLILCACRDRFKPGRLHECW